MNKKTVRRISLFLSLVLVLSLFPTNAFAVGNGQGLKGTIAYEDESGTTPENLETPEPTPEPEPTESSSQDFTKDISDISISDLVDENGYLTDEALLSLKSLPYEEEKYTDVKDNKDGTNSLKLYSSPIKYKNNKGKWEYIDNSIVPADSSKNPNHKYRNKASDIEVFMSDSLVKSGAIEVNYNNYSIGFRPLNIKSTEEKDNSLSFSKKGQTGPGDTEYDKSKKYESITYSKTFNDNTDIEITPFESGIKENIILNQIPEETEFSYEFTVKNVVPILREDGNLYFIDVENGILVAAIPVPFMYDSAPEFVESYEIAVKLEKVGKNTYKYSLIPDRAFLEDRNTIYPVTIDPTVTTLVPDAAVADTFVSSRKSGTNYNADAHIKIGYSPTFYISRGLIKITNFPDCVFGNDISKVEYVAYQDYSGASSPTMEAHKITSDWNPQLVKWTTRPNYDPTILDENIVHAITTYRWDITSTAIGWINSPSTNYGICIKNDNESLNMYKRFCSVESSANKNYFEFTYSDTTAPDQPTSLTEPTMNFTSDVGSITIGCSKCTDNPPDTYGAGMKEYWFEISLDGGVIWGDRKVITYDGSDYQYATFESIPDNTSVVIRACAVDTNENASGWTTSSAFSTSDKTGPTAPASFSVSVDNPSPNGYTSDTSPTVVWSGITDEGNHLDHVEYKVDEGTWTDIGTGYGTDSGSYAIDASSWSEGQHKIRLRGVDSSSNNGEPTADEYNYFKDTAAPDITLTVEPSGNLKGIVNIKATIVNAGGSEFDNWVLDYGLGNPATSFVTPSLVSGTTTVSDQVIFEWDTTELIEGQYYTIRLTASDKADNEAYETVILLKSSDSIEITAGLQIDEPSGYDPDGNQPDIEDADQHVISTPSIEVKYQKDGGGGITGLSDGKLYANNKLVNNNPDVDTENGQIINTFNAAAYDNGWVFPEGSLVFLYTKAKDSIEGDLYSTSTQQALELTDTFDNTGKIDESTLDNVEQANGLMQLINTSITGRFESDIQTFAGDISYIDLTVSQTTPGNSNIVYQVSIDGGTSWILITPVSTDGGVTVDLGNRKYFITNPTGDSVKLRATLTPDNGAPTVLSWSIDVRYTTYVNAVLVDNTFPENTRGITGLTDVSHCVADGSIKLNRIPPELSFYYSEGYVYSTVRYASNDVIEACLEVDETIETNTDIEYYIITEAGEEIITPGNASNPGDWIELAHPGTQIVIMAKLKSSDGVNTPALNSWRLSIKEKIAGQPYMVKLVDEPWNLSTLPGANYMTLLRWEASQTEGATYNVYRSTDPFFVPSEGTRVAQGIEENSWSDYNLNYGQTFYYKVTAVKEIDGHLRESLPSNEDFATVVSEGEVNKRLGLENYWSYTGFGTGSGAGYVNVSNGNLVYSTTDMVVSDPFFASVMRRTFNSMADSKTPMGYGWDFSFNTCLLREYQFDGVTEKGMILKDGDGSFHSFAKSGSVYLPAVGTFMELTFSDNNTPLDTSDDEYRIKRRDNIVYHFNAQSMKLKGFSDNNGNELTFRYDDRGNLSEVENTVGEKITLAYHVQGALPADPDYTYVNEHPDMLETITWEEDTETDPVSITYHYEYNAGDRLTRAYTTIEGSTTYEEVFAYNANGELVTISDPEDKETGISYDTSGRAERITSANGDYYDYAYADLGYNITEQRLEYKTTVTSKYGAGIQYKYDGDGLLFEKDDPLFDPAHPLEHCIKYTHNGDYLVTGMSYYNNVDGGAPEQISCAYTYNNGNIDTITGPEGLTADYGAYNSFNKPLSVTAYKSETETQTTYFAYDIYGNLETTTDPEGKVTTNTYSTVNGHYGYLTQVESDFGGQTRYEYDGKGRVQYVKAYDNGTYECTSSTYDYDYNEDGYFMRVTVTDAMGSSVTSYYDMLGRIVKKVYPDNPDNTVSPDMYERWSYSLAGNLLWARNTNGEEITYTYDDMYRLTDTHYPDGSTGSIDYLKWDSDSNPATGDANGNDADKIVQTDGTGVQSISYSDIGGRLLKTSVSNGTSEIVNARYQYDLIGNCTQVTDSADRVSQAQYNSLGQTSRTITDPTGENIQVLFDYDRMGNKLSVTNGEGFVTSYEYDGDSRLLSVAQTDNKGTPTTGDDETLTTSHAYDIEEGGYIKNRVTDAEGHVSETWFDALGRKVKDVNDGVTNDGTVIETGYRYNDNFQVELITRNDGTLVENVYNALGRLSQVNYFADQADYDEYHGPNNVVDDDDYILYEYDNGGRVKLESVYHGTDDNTTAYAYDEMGRVSQMTQGYLQTGALSIDYAYDDAGRVVEISYTKDGTMRKLGYVYDGYGRIQYITLALGTDPADTAREYVYKTNGELDYIKDFRDFEGDAMDYIKKAYERNSAGLTTGITYTDYEYNNGTYTDSVKEDYTLGYDDRGYITSETAVTNYGEQKTIDKTYDYDSIGRLLNAVVDNNVDDPVTRAYTYDNVGNRLTMSDGTDSFVYSFDSTGFNRLTGITKNGAFEASYTYDDRGNQKQEISHYFDVVVDEETTNYNQTTDYTYDLMDKMAEADISTPEGDQQGNVTYNNTITTNKYNAQGIRAERVEDGQVTKYYYTGSALLYTVNASNWLTTENILDPGGKIIASARFDEYEGYYFYNYDKRGSTSAIVQPDGSLITGYEYDEFGNLEQSGDAGFLNDVTFTGSVSDTSTGLQYMNARHYNPKTGRFLSQDTYSGNPYDPWTQHLYAYCGNNPTSMIDPTGHFYYLMIDGQLTQFSSSDDAYLTYEPEPAGYRDPDPEEHPITDDEVRKRAKYIYYHLYDLGWDDDAIYAVLGNLYLETGWTLDPSTESTSETDSGYGLAQWTGLGYKKGVPYNRQALQDYLDEKGYAYDSLEGQMEFLVYSMQRGNGQWKRPENEDYYNYFLSPEHFASGDLTYLDDPSLFPEEMTKVQILTQIFFYSYERSGDFFNKNRYWFGEQ